MRGATTTTAASATNTSSTTATAAGGRQRRLVRTCRICHGQGNLIRACECRGSCAYVHAACLQMWVTHRQATGMTMRDATTCELCLRPFAHRLERRHFARFLVSRGAWRAWAHIAYLAFCGRRVLSAGTSVAGLLAGCGDSSRRTPTQWPRVRTGSMLALHYWLLFVLDARLLLAVFRRWRDMNTTIVVCERERRDGEEGDEAEDQDQEAGDEEVGDEGDGVVGSGGDRSEGRSVGG